MTDSSSTMHRRWHRLLPLFAALLFFFFAAGAMASPGAHGPNGEHLDGPAQAAAGTGNAPRMEARSESFELIGQLRDDEFSLLVNRFETNEPVLGAKIEIETGALKAAAKFHADMGDYAVDDAAFLKALKAPGAHPMVITIVAGAEADLLEGTLTSEGAEAHSHDGENGHGLPVTAWLVLALVALGLLIHALSRRPGAGTATRPGDAR